MEKAIGLVVLIASACAVSNSAQAAEGPWMVRVRALSMQNDNKNEATALTQALGEVQLENKVFPEVDISYFFAKTLLRS